MSILEWSAGSLCLVHSSNSSHKRWWCLSKIHTSTAEQRRCTMLSPPLLSSVESSSSLHTWSAFLSCTDSWACRTAQCPKLQATSSGFDLARLSHCLWCKTHKEQSSKHHTAALPLAPPFFQEALVSSMRVVSQQSLWIWTQPRALRLSAGTRTGRACNQDWRERWWYAG